MRELSHPRPRNVPLVALYALFLGASSLRGTAADVDPGKSAAPAPPAAPAILRAGPAPPATAPPPASAPATASGFPRTAAAIRQLAREQLAHGPLPAEVEGTVTFAVASPSPTYSLQDATGGIFFSGPAVPEGLQPGDRLHVQGWATTGRFAPILEATNIARIGRGEVPAARAPDPARLLIGGEEGQRLELAGVVRHVEVTPGMTRWNIAGDLGPFEAQIADTRDGDVSRPEAWVGASVRIRGVCASDFNARRQFSGYRLLVAAAQDIQRSAPAPGDPFALKATPLGRIGDFDADARPGRMVRVTGIVTWSDGAKEFQIQDGGDGIPVMLARAGAPAVGDRVEVAGFPSTGGPGLALEFARVKKTGTSPLPAPRAIELQTLNPDCDNLLASAEVVYVDATQRGEQVELAFADAAGRHISATVPRASWDPGRAGLEPGSRVRLTGVYRLQAAAGPGVTGHEFRLRGPEDVASLTPARLWTRQSATAAAGVLGMVVLGGFAWTAILNRRLRSQRTELEARMTHQLALEQRHRELTEGAPDAIFAIDSTGRIVSANPAAAAMVGYTEEELRQMRIFDILPPDQRSRAAARIADRFHHGGLGPELLVEVVNRAGHRRIVEVTSRLLTPPNSPPILEGVARDATDRKRAEDALKTLATMAALGGGREFCRAVTRQVAELLGMRYASVATVVPGHPDRLQTLAFFAGGDFKPDAEYALEGTPCQGVFGNKECLVTRDASRRYPSDLSLRQMGVECYLGIPMWNSRNEPVGVLNLMHTQPFEPSQVQLDMLRVLAARTGAEIERLASAEALRTSEERFRQLAEQTEDVLWVLDLQPLRLAYIGASVARLAGVTTPGFNPGLRALLRLVHPADRPGLVSRLRECAAGVEERHSSEFRIIRANGGIRWVLDQGVVLRNAEGRSLRISGVARDITARKQAELALTAERTRFRQLFENSPDAIFVESLEGVVLEANRAACELHRLGPDQLIGRHFTDLVPPDGREEARAAFQKLVSGEASILEGFSLRSDGTTIPVELRVSRFSHGDQTALLAHVRDVTRRHAGEVFMAGQKRILEWIAMARPVADILAELVRVAEARSPEARCWIHWFPDDDVTLPWIAAPSLDANGVAALRIAWGRDGELESLPELRDGPFVVADGDPASPAAGPMIRLSRQLGGGAVVATPIVTPSGRRLGTFGTLCPAGARPEESDLDLNRLAASLAGVAIDRHLGDTELREGAERLQIANSSLLTLARSDALSRGDLGISLGEITEAAARSMGVARVSVWLLEEQDTVLRCLHEFDPSGPSTEHAHDLRIEDHGPYFEAITRERQITITDVRGDPRFAPMLEALLEPLRIRALLDAGIRLRGRLAGVLCFEHRGGPRRWKAAEALIAASLADIVAMALQASERRCIEEALRQSEEAYRSVVGALAEGVILVSRDGSLLTFNESAAEILGLNTRQLGERRLTDGAWELFHPDGSRFDPAAHPALVTLSTGKPITDQPLGVLRPDGKTAWLSVNTRPFNRDSGGEVASVVVSFTDITRRQEAEKALLEGNTLLQAITETQARFITDSTADRTLERMLATLIGMTECEHGLLAEVTRTPEGPPALSIYPPAGGPDALPPARQVAVDDLVSQVLAHGAVVTRTLAQEPHGNAARAERRSGPAPLHHLLALPLRHENEVVGVVCLGRGGRPFDENLARRLEPLLVTCANLILAIRTDRRRELAESQIRQLNSELELRVERRTADLQAINQELAEFAYVVTHDLKAPLRGIHQLSEWLAQDHTSQLDASGLRLLSLLRQRVQHLQQLIDGLLACARVGRSPEPERKVTTRDLVKQVLAVLAPPGHVRIHVAEDLPVIEGNPDRLHQVFQNLLDNAVKYLDKPHGRIGVTAVREKGAWTFRVADNGPGIPARYRDKVFQIFQRLHQTAEIPGTGLGLTLVKRIVESRGGKIWIESEDGLGTTVCFTWPDEGRQRTLVFGATPAPAPTGTAAPGSGGNGHGGAPAGPVPSLPPTPATASATPSRPTGTTSRQAAR